VSPTCSRKPVVANPDTTTGDFERFHIAPQEDGASTGFDRTPAPDDAADPYPDDARDFALHTLDAASRTLQAAADIARRADKANRRAAKQIRTATLKLAPRPRSPRPALRRQRPDQPQTRSPAKPAGHRRASPNPLSPSSLERSRGDRAPRRSPKAKRAAALLLAIIHAVLAALLALLLGTLANTFFSHDVETPRVTPSAPRAPPTHQQTVEPQHGKSPTKRNRQKPARPRSSSEARMRQAESQPPSRTHGGLP
jgi:hypothetical protein